MKGRHTSTFEAELCLTSAGYVVAAYCELDDHLENRDRVINQTVRGSIVGSLLTEQWGHLLQF